MNISLYDVSVWVLPVIIAIFGMVAVHGRQGWLPQLLHGLGLDPGNYLYGLFGILLAHVFFNMPLAARLILLSIESIPESSWRLASQLGMRSSHIFRLLEWPLIRGILPGLASLIFMLCFTSFTTVLALGGGPKSTTLEVAVYQALRFDFDLATAGALQRHIVQPDARVAAGLSGLRDAVVSDDLDWTLPGVGLVVAGLGFAVLTVLAWRLRRSS